MMSSGFHASALSPVCQALCLAPGYRHNVLAGKETAGRGGPGTRASLRERWYSPAWGRMVTAKTWRPGTCGPQEEPGLLGSGHWVMGGGWRAVALSPMCSFSFRVQLLLTTHHRDPPYPAVL